MVNEGLPAGSMSAARPSRSGAATKRVDGW